MLDPFRQAPYRSAQNRRVRRNVALLAPLTHQVSSALRLSFPPSHKHMQAELRRHWPFSAPRWLLHTSPSPDRSPRVRGVLEGKWRPSLSSSETVRLLGHTAAGS